MSTKPSDASGPIDEKSTGSGKGLYWLVFPVVLGPALLTIVLLVMAQPAMAQTFTLDLGADSSLTARIVQLFLLITVLSLAPGIAIMVTCFPFMVTVLSILRQGLGVQQAPPNMLIVSLALFLTYFVMEPVFSQAWKEGMAPYMDGNITDSQALERSLRPFQAFMLSRTDIDTLADMQELAPKKREEGAEEDAAADRADSGEADELASPVALSVLIPSFMLSEITRAFKIGFLIFLPFLVIDLVVASILMSMGMMLVPPAVVALPFKLAFFVLADGWTLIAGTLISGYAS